MKYSNVQMWVALDGIGQQVFIEDSKLGQDYICPICGGIVRARAKDSECVTEHFYHLDKSECDGESLLHIYWKNNLVNIGDIITLPVIGEVACIDKRIEFVFNTKEGIYKPDLIIKTNNEQYKFIIFEIHNTNKKVVEEYYNKWTELKYTVFEVDVKKLNKDKSNLYSQIKILYDFSREKFIQDSKRKISSLYNLLKVRKYYYDKYDVEEILSKFYRIFKNNLNRCTKNKVKKLDVALNQKFWDRDIYKDLVSPLLKINEKLNLYV